MSAPREVCGVDICVGEAVPGKSLCIVHVVAKRVEHVNAGARCTSCRQQIRTGEWITAESRATAMTHVLCPKPRLSPAGRDEHKTLPFEGNDARDEPSQPR